MLTQKFVRFFLLFAKMAMLAIGVSIALYLSSSILLSFSKIQAEEEKRKMSVEFQMERLGACIVKDEDEDRETGRISYPGCFVYYNEAHGSYVEMLWARQISKGGNLAVQTAMPATGMRSGPIRASEFVKIRGAALLIYPEHPQWEKFARAYFSGGKPQF